MLTDNPNAPLILVVEDDNSHALLIQCSIEDAPVEYRLERVATIRCAKTAMEQHPPDLVLTDYQLPDGDGSELVVMAAGACPVIVMTSYGSERIAVEAMKIGAQDYIVKSPQAFEALPRTVAQALKVWSLIQSRRQADKAVLRAKTDWERTFDAVPDLISIIDLNHTITRVNKAMAERCGLTVEAIVGRKCHEVMHDTSAPHPFCPQKRMIQGGIGHSSQVEEKRLNSVFDITVSPLYNTEGELTACVHVAHDITERKQAEEKLRESEEKYRKLANEERVILNSSPVGICMLKNRKILSSNPAFDLIFGYEVGTTLGLDTAVLYFDDEYYESVGQNAYPALNSGNSYFAEAIMKRKNGSTFWCSLIGHAITPGCLEDGSIWIFIDITERKRAEEEKLLLENQFRQAQKLESLGVLAGGIAHDFNNILTVILGHCYMAIEDLIPAEKLKSTFRQIETAGNRAADLCRQMLTYAGKSPQSKTRVNLLLLVDEIVKMLQSAIKKNVTIHLDLKRDVPEIKGDTGQIQQIIMNLIINAVEAIGEANGTITVGLEKMVVASDQTSTDTFGSAVNAGIYSCLVVSDTGCGMDEETQKRIFEPFYTTKFTGRGLGMSAIHGIIKSHEGILQLHSTPGVGTTFKILFPVPAESDATEVTLTETAPAEKTGGTVLLVEDEQALLMMGTALLEAMGLSVVTASNGSEARNIYRERGSDINVVLMDLIMPVMGGIEAYHELRKINQKVPIIICSGYGVDSVEDIIKNDPHSGFMHKPYKPNELRDVVMGMIELVPLRSGVS